MKKWRQALALWITLILLSASLPPAAFAEGNGWPSASESMPAEEGVSSFPANDDQASLQSMMPLKEIRLEDVNLSGRFKLELAQTPITDLLPGVEVPGGSSIVWAEAGEDDYKVNAPGDVIDLSDYAPRRGGNTYSQTFELIVGSPHQLDRTNIRYLVRVRFQTPTLTKLLVVDAVYASEGRGDIGVWNRTVYNYNDPPEYRLSADAALWTGEPVFLSFQKAETADENLTATVYEGAYHSLEEISKAGNEAVDITARIWNKSAVLKTEPASALYPADCEDEPEFTILWKRGDIPVLVTPLSVDIQSSADTVTFSLRDMQGSSIDYDSSSRDEETKVRTYYYQVEKKGQKYTDIFFLHANFRHHEESALYSEYGIRAVAGSRTYGTYQEALADFPNAYDITDIVFSEQGYGADYTRGIIFSFFDGSGERFAVRGVQTRVRERVLFGDLTKAGDSAFQPHYNGSDYIMPSAAYRADDLYTISASYQRDYENVNYAEYGLHIMAIPESSDYDDYDDYEDYTDAVSRGASDVTAFVLSSEGYRANFSGGITFFAFNGQGERIAYHTVRTVDFNTEPNVPDESTYFRVEGAQRTAEKSDGSYLSYFMPRDADSYYANGYQTVFLLDEQNPVNADTIYPTFYSPKTVKIFAEVGQTSGEEQISGFSPIRTTPGGLTEVKYSAASESGNRLQNYWVTFVTKHTGQAKLFVNAESRLDEASRLPIRELVLTQRNGAYHDVFFANIGEQDMTGISVSLKDAQNVILDPYWTVQEGASGNARTLAGFTTTNKSSYRDADGNLLSNHYGELANTAKVRIHPADSDIVGAVSGSLLIRSDNGGSREIKLTGVVGDICITTKTIRDGVRYVPYFSTIGTNNMYDPSAVRFELTDGSLPEGFSLYPNGVIYGVTKQPGEYSFSVKATFTYGGVEQSSDEADFTLVIKDNSNANVDAETNDPEYGYPIKTFMPDMVIYVNESGAMMNPEPSFDPNRGSSGLVQTFYGYHDALLVSEGDENQFVDLWLDGELLTLNVDYRLEDPGSTPVHALSSLLEKTPPGAHTFSMEFWTGGAKNEGKMKTTSENVYIQKNQSSSQNWSGQSNSSSGSSGSSTRYAIHVVQNPGGAVKVNRASAIKGQKITVTVTPQSGFTVERVRVEGTNVKGDVTVRGQGGTYTFTMPGKQVTVSASFQQSAYLIHVDDSISGGRLHVSHTSAEKGTRITITAEPESGYVLSGGSVKVWGTNVAGNVLLSDNGNSYSFIMPGKQVTVGAQFIPERFRTFVDVRGTDWFFDDVKWAYNKGLMLGMTEEYYEPESLISSVTAIVTLARLTPNVNLADYELASAASLGVKDTEWYRRELLWAKDAGLLLDGPFSAQAPISRGQFALMLEKYLIYSGIQTDFNWEALQMSVYEENMTPNQARAFQILQKANIFKGALDGRMYPYSYTTRANLAALLHRLSNYIIQYWQGDVKST